MASKTAIIASCAAVAVLCGCVLLANSNRIHLKHGLRSAHVSAPAARGRVASISKRCAPAAAAARLSKMPMQTTASSSKIAGRKFALAPLRSSSTDSEPASSSGLVVIPEDYRLGGSLLGVAFLLGPALHLWPQFFLHALIGGFLTFQTTRVRFRFSDSDLDVVLPTARRILRRERVHRLESAYLLDGDIKAKLKEVKDFADIAKLFQS
eukprot:jgi/Bigna1/71228/fgenesh1_pg.15_\